MKRVSVFAFFLLAILRTSHAQSDSSAKESEVRRAMKKQETAWNNFDIDEYLEGYWKSDSLIFVREEINAGWPNLFNLYKLTYSSQAEIGGLQFDITQVEALSRDVYVVTGRYAILRITTNLSGVFTYLFQKKNGKWVIVYDHTS